MQIEYFSKTQAISLIKNSSDELKRIKASKSQEEYFDKLHKILDQFHLIMTQVPKIRKLLPLDQRPKYNLLLQYTRNILSSIKISFRKSDYIALDSLINDEIFACVQSWNDFIKTAKW